MARAPWFGALESAEGAARGGAHLRCPFAAANRELAGVLVAVLWFSLCRLGVVWGGDLEGFAHFDRSQALDILRVLKCFKTLHKRKTQLRSG